MTEKENETSTDKSETGCGCLFMLVPAFIGYCLLSAFLVFPTGWNISEIFDNKIALIILAALGVLIIILLSPILWSEIRDVSLSDLRTVVWPILGIMGIILLIVTAKVLIRLIFR